MGTTRWTNPKNRAKHFAKSRTIAREHSTLAYVMPNFSSKGKGDATLYFWSAWVAQGDESQKLEFLRRNAEKGLPCGSEKFIRKLNWRSRRGLRYSIGHRDDRGRRIKRRGASLLRCFTMKKGSVTFTPCFPLTIGALPSHVAGCPAKPRIRVSRRSPNKALQRTGVMQSRLVA